MEDQDVISVARSCGLHIDPGTIAGQYNLEVCDYFGETVCSTTLSAPEGSLETMLRTVLVGWLDAESDERTHEDIIVDDVFARTLRELNEEGRR